VSFEQHREREEGREGRGVSFMPGFFGNEAKKKKREKIN
jgi:hypothetical protein